MADKPIGALPTAENIADDDNFVLEQNSTAKRLTGKTLVSFLLNRLNGRGGIKSIVKVTSTGLVDLYDINYTDGTSQRITITNGRGITGIDKVSTNGNVDTYAIRYNDGTSTQFTVLNGTNGKDGDDAYVWVRYASSQPSNANPSFGEVPDRWMGVYSGPDATAPKEWSAYNWYDTKGERGLSIYRVNGINRPLYRYSYDDLIMPADHTPKVGDLVITTDGYLASVAQVFADTEQVDVESTDIRLGGDSYVELLYGDDGLTVFDAVNSGRPVYLLYEDYRLPLVAWTTDVLSATFGGCFDDKIITCKFEGAVWSANVKTIEGATDETGEDNVVIVTEATTQAELSAAYNAGKVIVLKRYQAGGYKLYYHAGNWRFFRVADGVIEEAVYNAGTWTYNTVESGAGGDIFMGDADTTVAEYNAAFTSGKACFMIRPYGGTGNTMWTAYTCNQNNAQFYRITGNGDIQYGMLNSDGTFNYTTLGRTTTINEKSTDDQIPTAKAVYDAVKNKLGSNVEPTEHDIPKVFFGAPLQQTKDEIVTTFSYRSKTLSFDCYAEIKAQGNSTTRWPKKNQSVKLFKDAECAEKMKIDFKGWGKQNKFVIKAYWNDITHTRDIVSVRLESDCAKTRSDYAEMPEEIRTSPNMGAADGFPVLVWAAGIYQGRYMWNIPKDKWMNNMDDDLETHCLLMSEGYSDACLFRGPAKIDESDWTDEIHDTVPASIKTRWNEIITFVHTATDDQFRANLGNYFNVNSLIDRHLMGLYSCDYDGYGKNQRYDTYDGQLWYAVPYDKDGTWGCFWDGTKILPSDFGRDEYGDWPYGGNLLFIRLEQMFWHEMQSRWPKLKAGPLSMPNTINRFRELYDITPPHLREEDYASTTANGAFTNMPQVKNLTHQQFQTFVVERHAWMDRYVAGLKYVPCTGISLSASTLTFSSGEPQTITATPFPTDCTENVIWVSDNTDVATVSSGVVSPVGNGSCTITATCGAYSATCIVSVTGMTIFTVTNNLTNITTDNEATTAAENGNYTATLSPSGEEYAIDAVTVTMGGVDITATAYKDGVITIETVTGDIVITATAKANPILYRATNIGIGDIYWENGTKYYKRDSRINLLENDIDFTAVVDSAFASDITSSSIVRSIVTGTAGSPDVLIDKSKLSCVYGNGAVVSTALSPLPVTGDKYKAVVTHIAGSGKMNLYAKFGEQTYTLEANGEHTSITNTLQISNQQVLTNIKEFTVYNYAMTADEANAWLEAE